MCCCRPSLVMSLFLKAHEFPAVTTVWGGWTEPLIRNKAVPALRLISSSHLRSPLYHPLAPGAGYGT